ncbi:hypothetical protein V6243_07425 [Cobetia marina]|uniref:Uncharacterized protein n=1 Tax=Cobetia marina TaxID=28258 RepID=A0ABU9GHB1_COBMA
MEELKNTEAVYFHDIAQRFKSYFTSQAEDIDALNFFNDVYVALVSARRHPVVVMNRGNKYWDATISSLSKKLNSSNYTIGSSVVMFSQIYIIIAELLEASGQELISKEKISNNNPTTTSPSHLLSILNKIRSLEFLPKDRLLEKYSVEIEKRIDAYHNKYAPSLMEHRERKKLKSEIYDEVKKDSLRYKDLENDLHKKLGSVNKELSDTKEEINSIKEASSFLSARHGLSQLATQINKSVCLVMVIRYVLMGSLLVYLCLFLRSVENEISELHVLLSGLSYDDKGVSLDSSLVTYAFFTEMVKKTVINFIIVSLLLYFYKVALREETKMKDYIRDLEFKATITSFQEGNLSRVSELGGDVALSIERYERFLYSNFIDVGAGSTKEKSEESNNQEKAAYFSDVLKHMIKKDES